MSTSYVIFCQSYNDPVWGEQVIDWIHTGLVRVYRNRLRKAVFEWVGSSMPFDLEQVRKTYPICKYADAGASRSHTGIGKRRCRTGSKRHDRSAGKDFGRDGC